MKIIITPPARSELDEAAAYYETRRPGLAADFLHEFGVTFDRISEQPKAGTQFKNNVRYQVLNRFPYSVYYSEMSQKIVILAVAHQHRSPGYWVSRTGDNNKINEPNVAYAIS